jgi:hypothetical protein
MTTIRSTLDMPDLPPTTRPSRRLPAGISGAFGRPRGSIIRAAGFLRQELAGGPRPAHEILDRAREAGISERTLRRAKRLLAVRAKKVDFRGAWYWILPAGR